MQEEEGFDSNAGVELVEFSYRPLSLQQEGGRRPALTAKGRVQVLENYLPQRDECREECSQSVIMREQKYIVFNNFNHQVGLQQNQLVFQTQFDSSNLEIALRRKYLDYELYLRPDTNTPAHFQWFYFKVKSLRGRKTVSFTIKNFVKGNMLYSDGLRPYFKSSRYPGEDYKQLTNEVKFGENYCEEYYSLKFMYEFQGDGETVEFCSQPPYSYTRMTDRMKQTRAEIFTLCKSLLNKRVPYMIYNQKKTTKAIGIVIARQHPGESVGSWMMQGFLSRLETAALGEVMWVVFPMVNVDGVILGNNRTGISGLDYNRFWSIEQLQKKEKYLPEIVAIVNLIKNLRRKYPKKIKMFLDLHGHSSQPNVFSYGPPHEETSENFLISKVFPELLSRKNQNFCIQQCSYVIRQDKKNTARSLMFNYFGVPFSYTIEGSFGLMRGKRVGVKEFTKIGQDLVDTAQDFINTYVLKEKNTDVTTMVDFIRQKYKDNQEADEYDSDSDKDILNQPKQFQEKINKSSEIQITGRCLKIERTKMVTDVSTPYHKESIPEDTSKYQLFRVEHSVNHRYQKNSERKRNETEVTLSRQNKLNFLPKIKENLASKPNFKYVGSKQGDNSTAGTTSESPTMMNIKQIQKRLFRLRNSRIGKKILIINAYGV